MCNKGKNTIFFLEFFWGVKDRTNRERERFSVKRSSQLVWLYQVHHRYLDWCPDQNALACFSTPFSRFTRYFVFIRPLWFEVLYNQRLNRFFVAYMMLEVHISMWLNPWLIIIIKSIFSWHWWRWCSWGGGASPKWGLVRSIGILPCLDFITAFVIFSFNWTVSYILELIFVHSI